MVFVVLEKLTASEQSKIYMQFPVLKEQITKKGFVETPDGTGVLEGLVKTEGKLKASISLGAFHSNNYSVLISNKGNTFSFGYYARKEGLWRVGKNKYTQDELQSLFKSIQL